MLLSLALLWIFELSPNGTEIVFSSFITPKLFETLLEFSILLLIFCFNENRSSLINEFSLYNFSLILKISSIIFWYNEGLELIGIKSLFSK